MIICKVTITLASGRRCRNTGPYPSSCAAVAYGIDHFPDARAISVIVQRGAA